MPKLPILPSLTAIPRAWRAPTIGTILGLLFGIIEHVLDLGTRGAPRIAVMIDEGIVLCLPAIIGGLAGLVFNHVRKQEHLNRALSTQNAELQRDVFAQLLSSHILHEIRNPLHNLSAAIERWTPQLSPDQRVLLQRNLDRLEVATKQLTSWESVGEQVDVREPVPLRAWLEEFVEDKVRPQLHTEQIQLIRNLADTTVYMHPVLLEQCFVTLFNNALEAASAGAPPRSIQLATVSSHHLDGIVEVRMANSGARFPTDVLRRQGRESVDSRKGMGLGLVLVRRTLEQIGGTLTLSNDQGLATAILRIPGGSR